MISFQTPQTERNHRLGETISDEFVRNHCLAKSFPGDYQEIVKNLKRPKMKEKKKLVFWLVSHCETDNKREDYAKRLNSYIPVDIYGQCNWTETLNVKLTQQKNKKELNNLYKEYKFFLAFENSNCYDYVTEKFYRTLGQGVIPIVMGGAKNYKKMAPSKSYIDVRDYESPFKLAQYLKYLDKNDNEYLKYFDWIDHYGIYKLPQWCQLCQKLNDVTEPEKSYSNITHWWTHDPENNSACDV